MSDILILLLMALGAVAFGAVVWLSVENRRAEAKIDQHIDRLEEKLAAIEALRRLQGKHKAAQRKAKKLRRLRKLDII